MRPAEEAPLVACDAEVAEDVEIGDSSDDVQEQTGTPQRARSRNMLRTTLAVIMFAGLATLVVIGPVDNPLHASPEFMRKYDSFQDFWNDTQADAEENNLHEWGKNKAKEHWDNAEAYLDVHLSPQTREYMSEKIAAIKGLPVWAKQEGEEIFCKLRESFGGLDTGLKWRLEDKILDDFKDTTEPCGRDFLSQECRDDLVDDTCWKVGTMWISGRDTAGLSVWDIQDAPQNLCEVTFQEIFKHMQANLATDIVKAQQDIAETDGQSDTLLRTSVELQMGEVDKELDNFCGDKDWTR